MAETVADGSIFDDSTWSGGVVPSNGSTHYIKTICTAPTGVGSFGLYVQPTYGGHLTITGTVGIKSLTADAGGVNSHPECDSATVISTGGSLRVVEAVTAPSGGEGSIGGAGLDGLPLIRMKSGTSLLVGGTTTAGVGGTGGPGQNASSTEGGAPTFAGGYGGDAIIVEGTAVVTLGGGLYGGLGGGGGAGGTGYADDTPENSHDGSAGGAGQTGGIGVNLQAGSSGELTIIGTVCGGAGGGGGTGGNEGNWSDTYFGGGGAGGSGGSGERAVVQVSGSTVDITVNGMFTNSDNGAPGAAGSGAYGGAAGAGGSRAPAAQFVGYDDPESEGVYPDEGDVVSTASPYGPTGTEYEGTLDMSDYMLVADEATRNVDPGEENVKSGETYKIQNVDKTGTLPASSGGSGNILFGLGID